MRKMNRRFRENKKRDETLNPNTGVYVPLRTDEDRDVSFAANEDDSFSGMKDYALADESEIPEQDDGDYVSSEEFDDKNDGFPSVQKYSHSSYRNRHVRDYKKNQYHYEENTARPRHKKRKKYRTRSKHRNKGHKWKIVLGVVLLLILAVVLGFFAMRQMGKKSLLNHETIDGVDISAPEGVQIEEEGKTVLYNGKKYRRNDAVTSILCMGIDREDLEEETGLTGENGQADTLVLAVLDTSTGNLTLINISRDSMVDVDLYNIQDEYVETREMQLCLSYAYGDGKEASCKNTIKSVSRLMYGIPIDGYAAIDLSVIRMLNDAIGGVEVEVLEDMTDWNPNWVQGAHVLLQGDQAETYVRSRHSEGEKATVDSNNLRMSRQMQYLRNFVNKLISVVKKDLTMPVTLYNNITSNMVTDITASEVTYLASLVVEGRFGDQNIITVPGEIMMGEEYAEYHVDDEALYQILLDVFYTEV